MLGKKLTIVSLVAIVIALPLIISPRSQAQPNHVQGYVLVKFKKDTSLSLANFVANKSGAKLSKEVSRTGAYTASVPAGKETDVVGKLSQDPHVAYAELDVVGQAVSSPSYLERQWALNNIGQTFTSTTGAITIAAGMPDADIDAQEAWNVTRGNGVKVAVLDTGVDSNHEDISSTLTKNFTNTRSADDLYGHGTHVSGTIAARDNGFGVTGACPECLIISGKVLNDKGSGAASWVANGIIWATDNGAKVINMSLGFYTPSATLESAVNYAWNKGVVIVAAAGNDASNIKLYPAAYQNVIAVAATNNKDERASFSTYGADWVDIAAPGENIYATFPNHKFAIERLYGRSKNYDIASGTSMASPIVAATAALVWSKYPSFTNTQIRSQIESTADFIPGTNSFWLNGRVNAAAAVEYATPINP